MRVLLDLTLKGKAIQAQIIEHANVIFFLCYHCMHITWTFNFCRYLRKLLSDKHLLKVMLKGAQRSAKGIHLKWKHQQVFLKWCHYYSPENNTSFRNGKQFQRYCTFSPQLTYTDIPCKAGFCLGAMKICFKSYEVNFLSPPKPTESVTRIRPYVSNYNL